MKDCKHKEIAKSCPIGKVPCPGECIFADILENISLGIIVFDVTNKAIVFQNRVATDFFNKIKPRDYEALQALLLPGLEEYLDPTYQSPQLSLSYNGRIAGYTVYHIVKGFLWLFLADITEKIRAREALQASEERYHLLAAAVESAAEHIIITDTEGTIEYVNPAFERLTGYTKAEVIGQNPRILKSGKHNEDFYKVMWQTLKRGAVWKGRFTNRKKDGSLFEEDVIISPVKRPSGEIINYIAVNRDVTDEVRLESIAEAVNTMNNIGYIFSGIRHEIGNPINSIKVTLSVLKNKLESSSDTAVKDYVDRAMNEIARVEYLLRALKNFNMHESQNLQDVQVTSFMEKLLHLVEKDFEKNGIRITVIVHPDAEYLYADPRALHQVMLNILTNASDAFDGREDSTIVISVFKINKFITIQVVDNGCGIPLDHQKDLFKPFYTSKGSGTGLGLVIARKMLAQMNGTIEITSEKDAGTIVDISIPEGTGGHS